MKALDQVARILVTTRSLSSALDAIEPLVRERVVDYTFAVDEDGVRRGVIFYDATAPYLAEARALGLFAEGDVRGPAFEGAELVRGPFEDLCIEAEARDLYAE
jgi:hypothetical protein